MFVLKKLKLWQILLLIIFFPVGIVYLFLWSLKQLLEFFKESKNSDSATQSKQIMVFVFSGSKVYHTSPNCPFAVRNNTSTIPLEVAKKRGLKQCKKCLNSYW